jgi:hypothetical protein
VKSFTLEGVRSLIVGSVLAVGGVLVYLLPVLLSERAAELQDSARTLAQFLGGSAATAFVGGKWAEAFKHRAAKGGE